MKTRRNTRRGSKRTSKRRHLRHLRRNVQHLLTPGLQELSAGMSVRSADDSAARGTVLEVHGKNAFVEWDTGDRGWVAIDSLLLPPRKLKSGSSRANPRRRVRRRSKKRTSRRPKKRTSHRPKRNTRRRTSRSRR